jgi:O-methyltransferase involved in polyketide biosynthesis
MLVSTLAWWMGDDVTRDYSTISPSARGILQIKAHADVPFARAAVELMFGDAALADPPDPKRLAHFLVRYRSIDAALAELAPAAVLEVGAGWSFHGLALAAAREVFYVDTDLPAIAEAKAELVARLHPEPLLGTLRVRGLDTLDPEAFAAVVAELPPGPIAIVNEGLLMYLDEAEQRRLCGNVRAALAARGGTWVTADVYLRRTRDRAPVGDARWEAFRTQHKLDDKMFVDWAAAERLFEECGLAIQRRVSPRDDGGQIRETWWLGVR